MIWPFKRDPLESNADLLVEAVNNLAISTFPKFIDEFAFIPHDERGRQYWGFVVTIAGVFIALIGLRTLNLNKKRRLKLEKKVAACLVRLYPAIARPAFEKCKSHFSTRPIMIFQMRVTSHSLLHPIQSEDGWFGQSWVTRLRRNRRSS